MTKDNSEDCETICLVIDPAYRGGPTIKLPPGYFTPPSEPANKVETTADLNNALMEATIKELEKLERNFSVTTTFSVRLPTPDELSQGIYVLI